MPEYRKKLLPIARTLVDELSREDFEGCIVRELVLGMHEEVTRDDAPVVGENLSWASAAPGMLAALIRIRDARDSIAAGNVPFDLQGREFDDWAADTAQAAIDKAEPKPVTA